MIDTVKEYRYGTRVRQRAVLWCGLSVVAFVGLTVVLAQLWPVYGWGSRALGIFLLLILLFTVRAQLGRVFYRLRIDLDAINVFAPLANRVISLDRVTEVRRTKIHSGTKRRWACTLLLRNALGTSTPVFVFDDQLEDAEEALNQIVRQTPNAQHRI